MTAPYLGGTRITGAEWLSAAALAVRFTSTYGSTYLYQLYAGRSLAGTTASPTARQVVGQIAPSQWPQHLTLLAVEPSQRLTDYGALLPRRPYNKARLRFQTSGWPSDARSIDVLAGTTPGGAVDADNRIARVPFDTNRQYAILTPPMPGSGQWNFEVIGRDDTLPEGNAGTALALSAQLLAHPPDVALASDGSRFGVSIENQQATVTFAYPE